MNARNSLLFLTLILISCSGSDKRTPQSLSGCFGVNSLQAGRAGGRVTFQIRGGKISLLSRSCGDRGPNNAWISPQSEQKIFDVAKGLPRGGPIRNYYVDGEIEAEVYIGRSNNLLHIYDVSELEIGTEPSWKSRLR